MATDPLTTTKYNSALKILFPQKTLTRYGQDKQPFWEYLPKKTDFYGRKGEVPIRYVPGGAGHSHTFAQALANKGSSLYTHFEVTRKRDFAIISLDNEALEASENDKGAYMSGKKSEVEAHLIRLKQQLGADLQGNGSGLILTIATVDAANNRFTVAQSDMVRLEIGMILEFYVTPFAAANKRNGVLGYGVVTIVDYDNNRVTLSATAGDTVTVLGLVAADKGCPVGNFGLSVSGMEAWTPTDRTNLATTFNGVVRSVFPSRLAGIYFDGSTMGLAEALEKGLARGAIEGCFPDKIWVSFNTFTNISLDLGAKAVREPVKIGEFGYDSIAVHGGGRKVSVVADQNLADTTALGTTREGLYFWSLKPVPRFLTGDGNQTIIESTADGIELRLGWRGEMVVNSPGEQMRWKLPT